MMSSIKVNERSLEMKKMNSPFSMSVLIILLMSALLSNAFARTNSKNKPYAYVASDYSQLKTLKKGDVQILPQKFLREYDPVTFFLKSNVGKEGGTPENYADKFVSISPKHPGEYIWLDSKTLEFRPTVAWPPIQEFKIKMGASNKKLSTLLAPPVRTFPKNGSTDLSPVEFVKLHFSYKVPVEKLKKLIKFEVCPLPGLDKNLCNYITSADYTIKEQIQNNSGEFPYTFKFKQKIKLGQKVKIWVRLSDQEGLSDGVRSYSFETKEEFRLSQVGSYNNKLGINDNGSHYPSEQSVALGANGQIVLDFTASPQLMTITQIKNFLNFSPSPIELKHSQNGKRITLNVKFERERLYKLTLNPIKIKDKQNRPLKISKKSSLYFYQKGPQEFVRWSKTYGLLERFGPQQIPLNIAGTEGLDLRIYKIDPLSKAFWPFPSSALAVDESELPPGPGEEPELESSIMSPLSSSKAKKHIKMLGAPHYSNVINTKEERLNFFQNLDLKDKLTEISGAGKPGTYLVGIRELNGSTIRHYVKVQVTDLVLTSVESKNEVFFSVTSYKTGKPVEGAEIGIEGIEKSTDRNSNSKFERVWSCETNSKGYCKVSNKELYKKSYTFYSKRVVVEKKGDFVVFETNQNKAPLKFVNNHWRQNNSGWLSWLTNKPYDKSQDITTKAFIFTERPIYRPSEKVYIKGYVRSLKHGKLKKITSGDYTLRIAGGGKSEYVKVKLNSYGSFSHELQKEKMPTGNYHVTLVKDYYSKTHSRRDLNSTSFLVDAYRVPKFEVKVDGPRRVPNDKAFDVNLIAKYYAGGRLNESPIRWKVNAYPHTYTLKGWDGFLLSSDKRYSPRRGFNYEGTQEKHGKTDADGFAKLRINPQESKNANPVKYVYEATVTDVDQQTASDVKSVISLPPFVLGLKLNRHIRSGKDIAFKLAAIGVDEKALKNQSVHIHLKKMSWVSYLQETDFAKGKPKYVTEENVFTVEERDIKTKSKASEVVFKNQEPGVYILEIDSKDKLGRLQTLKVDLFLAGDKPMSWKKSEDQVFKTVPDKKEYSAGQTANILLQSPYQKALALAVLELPDGSIKYDWVDIKNGQGNYSVVIQSDMVRRVPVNFLIFRPRLSQPRVMPEGNKIDLGKPESVANTTWLKIKPDANKVKIGLDHKMTALPGSDLKINIKLSTPKGKAVPGEVTLWLVDEAVLSLAKESSINPLRHFLVTPNSNITLRDSRNMAMGDLRVRDNPGGDGMFSKMGAAESMMGDITVRKNFKTVPFYKSTIKVGKSGQASVKVPLPDNLTNFAIRAVAVSGSSRFGSQKSKIKIRLPVIVQPALPRFVRTGDVFKAGGVARSVEGKGGSSFFSLTTEGLKEVNSKSSSKVESFVLPDKKPIRLFKTFEATDPGYDNEGKLLQDSIKVTMAVRKSTDKKGDAFEVKIPLKADRSFVQNFYSQEMTGDSVLSWNKITEDYRAKTLSRELSLGSNLGIVNAMQALRYQLEYPHGCIEQRVSQVYPSLVYNKVWKQLGLKNIDTKFEDRVNELLDYLEKNQNSDGLFGYWPGSTPYVYLTAYVGEFLVEVKRSNYKRKNGKWVYKFNEKVLQKSLRALERSLRSDYSGFLNGYSYYERSAALFTLVKSGKRSLSYLKELNRHVQFMDVLSKARLYISMQESGKGLKESLSKLEGDLWNEMVFKLKDGQEVFGGLQKSSHRIGAEVHGSQVNELAGVVGALTPYISSDNKKQTKRVNQMTDALIGMGGEEGWGSTYTNTLTLLALEKHLDKLKSSKKTIDFKLEQNSKVENLVYAEKSGVFQKSLTNSAAGKVYFGNNAKVEGVYANMVEKYMPKSLGAFLEAEQNGFMVKRQHIKVKQSSADKSPVKKYWIDKSGMEFKVKLGEIVEERVQVVNPKKSDFVAISIPLAAGFEYLNPELKTAASEFKPTGKNTIKADFQYILDDQLVYYFDRLAEGTYDFYFRVRSTVEGSFSQPSAKAEMMYKMKVNGKSNGALIVVEP